MCAGFRSPSSESIDFHLLHTIFFFRLCRTLSTMKVKRNVRALTMMVDYDESKKKTLFIMFAIGRFLFISFLFFVCFAFDRFSVLESCRGITQKKKKLMENCCDFVRYTLVLKRLQFIESWPTERNSTRFPTLLC